ncbi:guanylin-like [Rhinoraja longicauda]
MKIFIAFILLSSSLAGIVIQIGEFKFPVQDVIQLKPLMENNTTKSQFSLYTSVMELCGNADLPHNFKAICTKNDAPHIFDTLNRIATYPYPCMICSYGFCTGCN